MLSAVLHIIQKHSKLILSWKQTGPGNIDKKDHKLMREQTITVVDSGKRTKEKKFYCLNSLLIIVTGVQRS